MTRTPPRRIVILTGAGISRESGLHTFRDPDGIWATTSIEEVATPEAFARNPDKVQAFYNARRSQLVARDAAGERVVVPNAAHHALAELEEEWEGDVLLVTQNIDDLHDRAGSINLVHMHGELLRAVCARCDAVVRCETDLAVSDVCGSCGATGSLRPRVVWFGEMPLEMERVYAALERCDLFMSIGTSGNVYPAAGFVQEARRNGRAHTVELNLEPSEGTSLFHEAHHGPATEVVPAYVDALLRAARGFAANDD